MKEHNEITVIASNMKVILPPRDVKRSKEIKMEINEGFMEKTNGDVWSESWDKFSW